MKKVKKMLSLLTATALVATLAACGSPQNDTGAANGGGNTDGEKLKKITIFQSKVEITEPLEQLAKTYQQETGNEVEVWGAAGDAYMQQLVARLGSNQGPTIFSVAQGPEAERLKSYLTDLSDEEFVQNIAPDMELKDEDKIVGIPYGVEGFGLVYNNKLVNPSDITDLDSFTKFLEQMKAEGKNGLSLSQEAYFLIGHILNTPFALQQEPLEFIDQLNKGEVKMADTPEFQEWAKFMEAIRAHATNPMEIKYDTQMGDFATGRTAMVHQGNWSFTMLEDFEDFGSNVGMMPFPLAGNDKIAVGVASYWVVNNQADAEEAKAAKAFLNWLFTSETGKKAIVDDFKFIPALTNIEAGNLDPLSEAVHEATSSGQTIPWALNYFPAGIITNDLAPATQEFFMDSSISGEQYLQKLDEVWARAAS
ncbi:ABC transporter substrate-binding protein [Paenibacillus cisolokensis]|uniref:extracellular solute-binding protein n=1 Tax=Paenibacillus cisolokensis TaxID=1658519 RepID=UPI003D2C8466